MNVIKILILVNIQTMKIANAEKKLVDQIIDECTETIEEAKLAKITLTENESGNKCSFVQCILYSW